MGKTRWLLATVALGLIWILVSGCFNENGGSNMKPVAQFTFEPREGYAPLTVTFDASGSTDPDGQIVLYTWDFGDGESAQGVMVQHTYAASGRYTVRLVVQDDKGATDEATAQVEVLNRPPEARFTFSPQEPMVGVAVTFDASGSVGEIVEYRWDFGDGSTGTGKIVTHTYTQPGQYRVQLTVRDSQNLTDSEEKWVTVRAQEAPEPLIARFTANPKEGQVPLTVNFDASSSTGPIVEYRWDFGDGATGSGKQVTHTYTQPGLFTVRLTVRAADGREAQAEDQILAAPVPPPPPG